MSKRCASEVSKALEAQRADLARRVCVMCKHGIPLHGQYHVIDELTDETMFGPQLRPTKLQTPLAMKCMME